MEDKERITNVENVEVMVNEKVILPKISIVGLSSMIMGILALIFSIIPLVNLLTYPLAFIAIILGVIALVIKNVKKSAAIAGIITAMISIVIATSINVSIFKFVFGGFTNVTPEQIQQTITKVQKDIEEGLRLNEFNLNNN